MIGQQAGAERVHRSTIGKIGGMDFGTAAGCLDVCLHAAQFVFATGNQTKPRAARSQLPGGRFADAARCAGDDDHLILQLPSAHAAVFPVCDRAE